MQPKMTVEELQGFLSVEFPQVADTYLVEAVGPMTCRLRMRPSERHLRPGNTISGPALFSLADCSVYLALLAMIGPEALAVTTNASIDFMRKPTAGQELLADATLLKLGRVLAVGDVLVRSVGSSDVVARATLTYSIPPKA
ncbi:MAG: PaaI family thioesterase [Boseongicola sp.]